MHQTGAPGIRWVLDTLRELKSRDPIAPVTILAANYVATREIVIAAGRVGCVGVRVLTIDALASELVGLPGADEPLTPEIENALVRHAIAGEAEFAEVSGVDLRAAARSLFRELRRAEADPAQIEAQQIVPAARAALRAYRTFDAEMARVVDRAEVLRRAAGRVASGATVPPAVAALGAIVLAFPTRLYAGQIRLLAALARWLPMRAAFVAIDGVPAEDDPERLHARMLARACGITEARIEPAAGEPTLPPRRAIRRVPDPAEEVRIAVRALVAHAERGAPFHRCAILYRQSDPYRALLVDALARADVPCYTSEGDPLAETRPGRALLGVLALGAEDFVIDRVLGWLETRPPAHRAREFPDAPVWARLAREARIVRGAASWQQQLRTLAAEIRERARQSLARDDASEGMARALERDAQSADAIVAIVGDLAAACAAPPDRTWSDHVEAALALIGTTIGSTGDWSPRWRVAAAAVERCVRGLTAHNRFADHRVPFVEFLSDLEQALRGTTLPRLHLGGGVFVGRVGNVAGLSFDRVQILGLVEGQFPAAPPNDPFFPAGGPDPLHLTVQRRASERRAFVAALATAAHLDGQVILSMPDTIGGRVTNPSRYLIEVASALHGAPLDGQRFLALSEEERTPAWLTTLRSPAGSARAAETPLNLDDRRRIEVARARAHARAHPIAHRPDLPLARGLDLSDSRRTAMLTDFDGGVGPSRLIAAVLATTTPVAPTAIEMYATCPFRYFLGRVLGVRETRDTEEIWTIDALERGSLYHDVLDEFFRNLPSAQGAGDPSEPSEWRRLVAILDRHIVRVGAVGSTVAWTNEQSTLRSDLSTYLRYDARDRAERGVQPRYTEQTFGGDDTTWPPVVIEVPGGHLSFRGRIDRVDLSADGRRAEVHDYKTGADRYKELEKDPVKGGQTLQLALYREAVRAALRGVESIGARYALVTARGEFKSVRVDERADVDARLRTVLSEIATGIATGSFPQVPGEEDRSSFENCRYCPYDRVCPAGRNLGWERKQADPKVQPFLNLAPGGDDRPEPPDEEVGA